MIFKRKETEKRVNNVKLLDEQIKKAIEELDGLQIGTEEYAKASKAVSDLTEAKVHLLENRTKLAAIFGTLALDGGGMVADGFAKQKLIDFETNGGCYVGQTEKGIAKKEIRRRGFRIHF